MTVPNQVTAWLETEGYGVVERHQPVSGGCINNGARVTTKSGTTFFLKQNLSAPENMFTREAEGLLALAVPDGPRVPTPYLAGTDFLLLEDLRPINPEQHYWEAFGRRLAALHGHVNDRFGFDHDNFIGSTPQPNPRTPDGHEFFAEQRLVYQAELALQQGLIDRRDFRSVLSLAARLVDLIPKQSASLLHGDLWSGNAITGPAGEPAFIDPAVHYGWGEAELGMTTLFGGFPQDFYESYESVRPLEPGWRERLPVYNLYHLLNHVNLFGEGYLGQVRSVLLRFQ